MELTAATPPQLIPDPLDDDHRRPVFLKKNRQFMAGIDRRRLALL
jgi:hypothetical protein